MTMRRLSWLGAMLALGACMRDDVQTKEKLDRISERVEAIDKRLDQALARGAGAGGQAARPPGPDPGSVYSVPIEGDPAWGPPTAKVTLVEAAEFA